jgi:hypothetical protein
MRRQSRFHPCIRSRIDNRLTRIKAKSRGQAYHSLLKGIGPFKEMENPK